MGIPNVVAYSAAKTAVAGMARALASEWSPHGVRVNSITPGWIKSDMTEKALDSDPPRKQKIMSRIFMGHMGSSEDIGWAAVYLSSPAARYVTGLICESTAERATLSSGPKLFLPPDTSQNRLSLLLCGFGRF